MSLLHYSYYKYHSEQYEPRSVINMTRIRNIHYTSIIWCIIILMSWEYIKGVYILSIMYNELFSS